MRISRAVFTFLALVFCLSFTLPSYAQKLNLPTAGSTSGGTYGGGGGGGGGGHNNKCGSCAGSCAGWCGSCPGCSKALSGSFCGSSTAGKCSADASKRDPNSSFIPKNNLKPADPLGR